jgi:hypothetical protein
MMFCFVFFFGLFGEWRGQLKDVELAPADKELLAQHTTDGVLAAPGDSIPEFADAVPEPEALEVSDGAAEDFGGDLADGAVTVAEEEDAGEDAGDGDGVLRPLDLQGGGDEDVEGRLPPADDGAEHIDEMHSREPPPLDDHDDN